MLISFLPSISPSTEPGQLHQQFARLSAQGPHASSWARAYLRDQLARGHSLSRARRALGNRWLAILFRLWQDRVAYDEQVHLRNRAQHGARSAV